ncbi:MAG TPA: YceD family protein [Candidatus Acidoferrales bacterium]|nr:YceD family protein [Candidatus Acidoferrales bacterium]
MSEPLPDLVDVDRLARRGARLEGRFAIVQFDRLRDMVAEPDGELSFVLRFYRDGEGRSRISGTIEASVVLVCQRCLQPMEQGLAAEVALVALAEERDLSQVPAEAEPLLTGGEPVRLIDLIEDEAILALPIVALHNHCTAPDRPVPVSFGGEVSPFAVLKRDR